MPKEAGRPYPDERSGLRGSYGLILFACVSLRLMRDAQCLLNGWMDG